MATTSVLKLRAVDQVTGVLKRIQRAFPVLDKKIDRTRKRLKMFQDRFKGATAAMRRFGNSARSIGRSMSTFITLPAIAAGAGIINSFRKYEKALIGVGKTTNLQGPVLRKLGKEFLDLSTKIPVSAVELLKMAEVAGQLGVGEKDIVSFTTETAKLAATTDLVGPDAIKRIARLLILTDGGVGRIKEFSSAIVALGNDAAASESEILGVAIRIAGNTARFKLSTESVLGLATTLKELGKEAELSGSATGRAFNAVSQAILNGGQEIKALQVILSGSGLKNLNKKGIGELFKKSPQKVIVGFLEGLSKIDKTGGNFIKVMKLLGLEGVRINDVFGTLIENVPLFKKRLAQAAENSVKSGKKLNAVDREFAAVLKALDSKIKLTTNSMTKLAIEVGEKLAPSFIEFLDVVRDIVSFLEANPFFVKLLGVTIAIAAVMGPLVAIMGAFLLVLPGLATAASALGLGLGGIALVIGGIPLLIAGIIIAITFMISNWEEASTAISNLWSALVSNGKALFSSFFGWLDDKFKGLLDLVTGVLPSSVQDFLASSGKVEQAIPRTNNLGTGRNELASTLFGAPRRSPNKSGSQNLNVNNSAQLEIKVDAPEGTVTKVKRQSGFDKLEVMRGLQGAF